MRDLISPAAQPFFFPEGTHGVLLIHGFTGTPAHMRLVGEGLRDRGYAVRGILLPGHGTQPQDMAKVSWQDWLLAARQAAQEMRERYAHFTVCGLSMGGVLALILAQEMDVTACVTLAAPMRTTNRFRLLAPLGALFHPMIHKGADSDRSCLDARYDVGYSAYPTASVHDLSVLMRRARQHLSLIHCPILAVQSHGDRTVTADSPDIILKGVSSAVKAHLWLQDAPHVCTIAPEYPKIVEGMDAFLKKAESK